MIKSNENLFGFSNTFDAAYEFIKSVRTNNSGILLINGGENAGKTALLRAIRVDLLREESINVLEIDLLDWSMPSALAMISIFESYLVKYYDTKSAEFTKLLSPFQEILTQAMPDFCENTWKIKTSTDENNQNKDKNTLDEASCFTMLCKLVKDNPDCPNTIVILIDNADSGNWNFLSVLEKIPILRLGIIATVTNAEHNIDRVSKDVAISVTTVNLPRLTDIDVLQMIQYEITNITNTTKLARTVVDVTKGNPKKVQDVIVLIKGSVKLISTINSGGSIREEIEAYIETSRIEYILDHYNVDQLQLVKYLSCFSGTFSFEHAVAALGLSKEESLSYLEKFKDDELIVSVSEENYRISHQSVSERLHDHLTEHDHKVVIKRLVQLYTNEENWFDITLSCVYLEHIEDIAFINSLDKLMFLERISYCFYLTRDYDRLSESLEEVTTVIPTIGWETDYDAVLKCLNCFIEYSLLPKNNSAMTLTLARYVIENTKDIADRDVAIDYQIQALKKENKYTAAIQVATKYLRTLGYRISDTSNIWSIIVDLIYLYFRLGLTRRREIRVAPLNSTKELYATVRIMRTMIGPVYVNAKTKWVLPRMILLGIKLVANNGVGPGATYARIGFELLFNGIRERVFILKKTGKQWRKSNSELVKQYDEIEYREWKDPFLRSRTGYLHTGFRLPLIDMKMATTGLWNAYEVSRESQDWEYMGYCSGTVSWYELFNGGTLDDVIKNMDYRMTLLNWVGDIGVNYNHVLLYRFIYRIRQQEYKSETVQVDVLSGLNRFLEYYADATYYFAENNSIAGYESAKLALDNLDGGQGLPICVAMYVYYCRFMLDVKPTFWKIKLHYYKKLVEYWAYENPSDFECYLFMMKSYIASSKGDSFSVIRNYNSALEHCKKENLFLRSILHREISELYEKVGDTNSSLYQDKYYREYYEKWSGVHITPMKLAGIDINSYMLSERISECLQRLSQCSTYNQLLNTLCVQLQDTFEQSVSGIIIQFKSEVDTFVCREGQPVVIHSSSLSTPEEMFHKYFTNDKTYMSAIPLRIDKTNLYIVSSTAIENPTPNKFAEILMQYSYTHARLIVRSDQLYRTIGFIDNISDAICVLTSNLDGVVTRSVYNNAFSLLVEIEPTKQFMYAEEIFKHITDQLFGDSATDLRRELRKNKNILKRDLRVKRKNGDVIDIVFSALDIHDLDNKNSTYVIVISDRDKLTIENNIRANMKTFSHYTHEIKTPASATAGLLNIVINNVLEEKPFLDILKRAIQSQDLLLETLNSSEDAFDSSQSNTTFNLRELVTTLINSQAALNGAIDIAFDKIINIDSSIEVKGNKLLVISIIQNLLGNAFKFTVKGRVTIHIDAKENGNDIVVTGLVQDTGIGIPKDRQEYIFENYSQVDARTERKYVGRGIGLYLVKSNCEKLGGYVRVSSNLGDGSIFSFRFDLTRDCDITNVKTINMWDIEGLLVEDDANLRESITYSMKKVGIGIKTAEDGFKALEMISDSDAFDIVFMDINLPGMDGYETALKLRKINKDIPIVAVTASDDSELQRKADSVGMQGVLIKPITNTQLDAILSTHFIPRSSVITGFRNMDEMLSRIKTDYKYISLDNIKNRCASIEEVNYKFNLAANGLKSFTDATTSKYSIKDKLHKVLAYVREVGTEDVINEIEGIYRRSVATGVEEREHEGIYKTIKCIHEDLVMAREIIRVKSNES